MNVSSNVCAGSGLKVSERWSTSPTHYAGKCAECDTVVDTIIDIAVNHGIRVRLVLCQPNRDRAKPDYHVHAEGCNDLRRYGSRGPLGGTMNPSAEYSSAESIIRQVHGDEWHDHVSDFKIFPCCGKLPKTETP